MRMGVEMKIVRTAGKELCFMYLRKYLDCRREILEKYDFDGIYYIGYVAKKKKIKMDYEATEYRAEYNKDDLIKLAVYCGTTWKKKMLFVTDRKDNREIVEKLSRLIEKVEKAQSMNIEDEELIWKYLKSGYTNFVDDVFQIIVLSDDDEIVCILRGRMGNYSRSLVVDEEKFNEMKIKAIVDEI